MPTELPTRAQAEVLEYMSSGRKLAQKEAGFNAATWQACWDRGWLDTEYDWCEVGVRHVQGERRVHAQPRCFITPAGRAALHAWREKEKRK